MTNAEKKFDKLSNQVIGKAIEVHKKLGPGFTENVYQNALLLEFKNAKIPFESEKEISVSYKEQLVGLYRIDVLVDGKIILALKTVNEINEDHISQVLSYLKTSGLNIGLILNFANTKLGIKRVVFDKKFQRFSTSKLS